MAKKSMSAREKRRWKKSENIDSRLRLKKIVSNEEASYEEQVQAMRKLEKLPRDNSRSRRRTRCQCCGRPRAVFRRFGICRICLRQAVMKGLVPGVTKSSW